MRDDAEAARARAEASFRKAERPGTQSAAAETERAVREKTERLRAARLAQEALRQKGAEIRKGRRRGA